MISEEVIVLCDHQTGYLPWLGLFHRISLCDIYVSLDTVKYNPRSYDSRNKIKTPDGFKWLKVPTQESDSELLKDVKIKNSTNWKSEHLKAISYSYRNTEFFDYYFKRIEHILNKDYECLMDLNEGLMMLFLKELKIDVKFFKASKLNISGSKNQYLINLCKNFNAGIYVFGQMGESYADKELWEKEDIKVFFHEYNHPVYKQKFNNFVPNLSVIDLLFNEGPEKSPLFIKEGNINREQMLQLLDKKFSSKANEKKI